MAEASRELEGPDFEKGCDIDEVQDGGMLLGHAFGEAILVARQGSQLFAIGATCTHYGGPLAKGLMVDCTVRCPWHHARFDLRTGEAIGAPALSDTPCWNIEREKTSAQTKIVASERGDRWRRRSRQCRGGNVAPRRLRRAGHAYRR